MEAQQAISLREFNQRLAYLVQQPSTQNVWVTAELSDVAVRRGHCYMELIEKDPSTGKDLAKCRAIIWSSAYPYIAGEFERATGQRFTSGLKVMVRVSATMSPLYGLSLIINAVNPEFTMGDALRRRREVLARLQREGVLEMNRQLEWPVVTQRVAVISAPGAAGYGDFINQLYNNPYSLRFTTKLFPAIMQGERAPQSIIAALSQVADELDLWDCVVIVRGGGATTDLGAYDDYELAANVAQFPIPVISGVGHERDVTVIDYVANIRVKTPTAAAEALISRGEALLSSLAEAARRVVLAATDKVSGAKEQLSYYQGALPVAPVHAVERARGRLGAALMSLSQVSARRVAPALSRLQMTADNLPEILRRQLSRRTDALSAAEQLIAVLSPAATLARGYSITRLNGHAVTDAAKLAEGDVVETILAGGAFTSTVKSITTK